MFKRILAAMMALVMILCCMPVPHAHAAETATTASGTTYYVSSTRGAEGNNGTSESAPFASLLTINEITLQPGDRVLLERGSVFVDEYLHIRGSGSAEAPILIDAYGDESLPLPLIQTNGNGVWYQDYGKRLDNVNHQNKGDVSSCILLYDVEYIEISNIAMTNEGSFAESEVYNSAYRMDRTGVAGVAENIGTVDHIYLRNLDIRNVQGNVYNKHMCNGGIYFVCHQADDASTGIARYDDILIEGCRLDEVNRWGIAVGYTAYWDSFPYGQTIDPDICRAYGSTNVVIRSNYLTNVGGDGITTMYCSEPLIEYNVLDGYCQDITDEIYVYEGSRGGQVAAGIWPWMCKSAVFQYNECYSSTYNQDGQAWDADWGDNAIYQYNYSCNNAGGAIMFCGTYAANTVFRYNISQDDLSGVLNLARSPNGEIYNNVFYVKEGVKISRDGMSGGWNNTISNNIFYYTGSTPADASLGNWDDITAAWSNNIYYNYSTTPDDAYAITDDPLFVDPGKGPTGAQANGLVHDISAFAGYKLNADSPAINAGIPVENNGGLDFFGSELDLIPDIGAHEAGTCDADASRAVLVDLELGQTLTLTDPIGDYGDAEPVIDNSKIASVDISGSTTVVRTHGDAVTALTDGKYILVNNRAGKTLTNQDAAAQEGEAGSMDGLSLDGTIDSISDHAVWTLTASGNGYTVRDSEGKYLSIRNNDADVVDSENTVNVNYRSDTWTLSQDGAYLNDAANKGVCASGWDGDGYYDASTDAGSLWTIYPVSEETVSSTELTFTGLYPGSTNIVVGDTLYLVRVSGKLQEVALEVGETAAFTDESGNYTDADTSALDSDVATVELTGLMTDVYTLGSKVTSLASGSKYILVNTRAGKPVTNAAASSAAGVGASAGLSLDGTKENVVAAAVWAITGSNGSYTVQDLEGNYMTVGNSSAAVTSDSTTLSLDYNGSTWTISRNGAYLNHFGGHSSNCAAGWQDYSAASDAGSQWDIYEVATSTAENGTQITFTAVGSGETHVRIGDTMYHITVTGTAHSFDNGFCDHCDEYQPAELVNGVYEIGNAGQLYWFRAHVADGNYDADAIVTDDITVNEDVLVDGELNEDAELRKWTGIGSTGSKYAGTFDGQGHTVSGLASRGLFTNVGVGGTVRNVTVANSCISGNGVAAIAHTNYGGTIENCTVTSSVINGTKGKVGGIVGSNYGTVTRCTNDGCPVYNEEPSSVGGIVGHNNDNGSDAGARKPVVSFCVNTGSVSTDYDSSERPVGGIVGENEEDGIISNCYNVGAIESTGDAVGGIVGYSNQGTIENCHNVGSVAGDAYVGSIVGRTIHPTKIQNSYYLEGCAADSKDTIQNGVGHKTKGSTTADTTGVAARSKAVFASGEVAYLLNGSTSEGDLVWKQTIGTDAYPKFEGAMVYFDSELGTYTNKGHTHTPGEPVRENERAATCTEAGSYASVVYCTECGEEISRETVTLPALGHTEEVIPAVEPTCTETGLTEGKKCAVCGEILVAQEVVDALGHDWHGTGCSRCDATRENPFTDVPENEFYIDPVLWAVEEGITRGATDTTFNPEGDLQRAQFVTMLWRASGEPEPTSNVNPFNDVKESDFFYKAVLWAAEKGITNGISATEFGSYDATNRAQAVTFLWRYLGQPESSTENIFSDVEAGQFYTEAVLWALENNVTNGMGGGTFGINGICNRAQAVTFLHRALAE